MQSVQCLFIEESANGDDFTIDAAVNMKTGEIDLVTDAYGHEKSFILFRGGKFPAARNEEGYYLDRRELENLASVYRSR